MKNQMQTINRYEPPEPSPLVKQIADMEKELDELRREIGNIRATMIVNYGTEGRDVDGIKVDPEGKSNIKLLVEILTQYSNRLKEQS
jgi:hypothetical protein